MSGQFCVDANIFIASWYINYPIDVFSSLWEQISQHKEDLVLLKPVYDEIEPISSSDNKLSIEKKKSKYPLRMWMQENEFTETRINDEIKALSLVLENEYKISSESKGAGENDITLIAYAKIYGKTVVTYESAQPQIPIKKCNYKIPLICQQQNVDCISFIKLLQLLEIKI